VTQLGELTFCEADQLRARRPIVLLPVGAVEAHGPHLPLSTDCIIAEEIATRAAATLPAVVAPTLAYTSAEYAAGFPGTVSVDREAVAEHLRSVLDALERAGFRRICLVSAHLEPAHLSSVRAAAGRASSPVAIADPTEPKWALRLHGGAARRFDGHAGIFETSLMLAARPDLVREAVRSRLPEVGASLVRAIAAGARTFEEAGGPAAYFGAPARASREIGEELYAILVEMVQVVCATSWPA